MRVASNVVCPNEICCKRPNAANANSSLRSGEFRDTSVAESLDVVKTGHAWDEFDVAVLSSLGSLANHEPRHVHVETTGGKLIGRLDLRTRQGMEGWQPDRKLLRVIEDLEREGRL